MKCLEMIRSYPALVGKRQGPSFERRMHQDGFDGSKETDICVESISCVAKWYLGSKQSRRKVIHELVQHISLECIDPLELSTTVRSAGFVSDSMLCDAYAKQAANKDDEASKKAANKDAEASKKDANKDAEANKKAANKYGKQEGCEQRCRSKQEGCEQRRRSKPEGCEMPKEIVLG
jgi:hypothetical protein